MGGDRLDAVDGEYYDKAIVRLLEEERGKTLKLTITKAGNPLTVKVKKPMGLTVFSHKSHQYLHVKPEETESMKNSNDPKLGEQLSVGDRILSVDNVFSDEPKTLLKMMMERKEMDLTFLRYQQFDASNFCLKRRKNSHNKKSR